MESVIQETPQDADHGDSEERQPKCCRCRNPLTNFTVQLALLNVAALALLTATMGTCSFLRDEISDRAGPHSITDQVFYGLFRRNDLEMKFESGGGVYNAPSSCQAWTADEKEDFFNTPWIAARVLARAAFLVGSCAFVVTFVMDWKRQTLPFWLIVGLYPSAAVLAITAAVVGAKSCSMLEDYFCESLVSQCFADPIVKVLYAMGVKVHCVDSNCDGGFRNCVDECREIGHCAYNCSPLELNENSEARQECEANCFDDHCDLCPDSEEHSCSLSYGAAFVILAGILYLALFMIVVHHRPGQQDRTKITPTSKGVANLNSDKESDHHNETAL